MTEDAVSERLLHQRLRNRIMEAVSALAEGVDEALAWGFGEYFETFYDHIPHREDGGLPALSTFNQAEISALKRVSSIVDAAADDTPQSMSEADFVASGWPQRIQVEAQAAVAVLNLRGRFCEEQEQDHPE